MNFSSQLLFFFSALGAFNGLFLSAYFAFFIKNRNRSTYFLAGLLFVVSVRVTKSVFLTFYDDISTHFIQVGLSACLLIGPFLYLYIREAMKPKKHGFYGWLIHILPVIIIMTILGYYFPYSDHQYLWQRSVQGYLSWLMFTQWFIYIILAFGLIKPILLKLPSKTEKLSSKEIWMTTVAIGVFIIWLAYFTSRYTSYIVGALSFSFVLYLSILFWILKRRKTSLFFEEHQKYASKKITSVEANDIEKKLSVIMETEALYKNPDIKLKDLADKLDVSSHFLSQLLNDNLDQSFAQYINGWRVEASKELLKDNENYTLEAIGFEAGFSSKSSFYSTFKKVTGVTPAIYKKQVS
ncbi:helix-turn-helix domain-containing protein [Winogradskyella maritima]|uniref:Helix-turn-helix domain-containing protein n=1 Tax=Winogradskyella maritima TaxID=1517766 RepID=A0ABV8AD48_9FLAO|nr:helix-turn-helix domain-containing protein [Winogradskyella maritima]